MLDYKCLLRPFSKIMLVTITWRNSLNKYETNPKFGVSCFRVIHRVSQAVAIIKNFHIDGVTVTY